MRTEQLQNSLMVLQLNYEEALLAVRWPWGQGALGPGPFPAEHAALLWTGLLWSAPPALVPPLCPAPVCSALLQPDNFSVLSSVFQLQWRKYSLQFSVERENELSEPEENWFLTSPFSLKGGIQILTV